MTLQKPSNRIVVQGQPLHDNFLIETVTTMYPGRLVKKGTADHQIVVNTVNNSPLGWLGYEQTENEEDKPDTVDTIWTAKWAPVLYGGGFVVVGSLANGVGAVTAGSLVCAAAAGEVTSATALTATTPTGTTAVTSTSATPAMTQGGAIPAQGELVGKLLVDADSTASAVDCIILSYI
jgi:hypothetical protein